MKQSSFLVKAFAFLFLFVGLFRSEATSTVSTLPNWYAQIGITGPGVDSGGGVYIAGQTFSINDANALVTDISFPIIVSGSLQLQVGVAAWNGSRPTGPLLYLSDPLMPSGEDWQTLSVSLGGLNLAQGQEYVMMFVPNYNYLGGVSSSSSLGYVDPGYYTDGQYFSVAGYQLGAADSFGSDWSGSPGSIAFSVDYIPVPEPSSCALVALSFAGLLFLKRK